MRRLDLLIEEARSLSDNKVYNTSGVGVPQSDFVFFANSAQNDIMREAAKVDSGLFPDEAEVSCVPGQEAYAFPDDIYLQKVSMMEFKSTGNDQDYSKLKKMSLHERRPRQGGDPRGYIPRGDNFLSVPNPGSAGTFRLSYLRKRGPLDIQRTNTTLISGAGSSLTGLTLVFSDAAAITYLNKLNYLTLVNAIGEVVVKNIKFSSINAGTGVVTLVGTHTLASGETLPSSAFVIGGYNARNIPDLPDECEEYLVKVMIAGGKTKNSKKEKDVEAARCLALLKDIIMGMADPGDDITEPTITDLDYISQYP